MSVPSATSLLASFVTLKALSDEKKYINAYQLLSEFTRYIIGTKRLYSFSAIEMKNALCEVFGFDVPEAVVKTSCKSIQGVDKKDNIFIVDRAIFSFDTSFEKAKTDAENMRANIICPLMEYIKEKNPTQNVTVDIATQALVAFLFGDQQSGIAQYSDIIGEFILKNAGNANIQEALAAIQEGSIWYIGINHNINETGSITKALTLYLGTEILFSLAGYNGEIHKKFAEDFFAQVRNANLNGEKVRLRYFSRTQEEIDAFFGSASLIAEGRMRALPTVAMKTILSRCTLASDVAIEKSDFYHLLKYSYGIVVDERTDYYSPDDEVYNLESLEYENQEDQDSWMFVSHINKLRRGKVATNNIDSEFLYVTNTRNTIKASEKQAQRDKESGNLERVNDYAVTLDRITSLLWYKLGNGFGRKEYPSSLDAVLKAKVVLASAISHNVTEAYNKTNEQYKNGEISRDQLAARIITLHRKPILPEELEGNSIDDCMDFTPEFMSRYEEEVKQNRLALKEKDELIKAKDKLIKEQREQQTAEIKRVTDEQMRQLQGKDETIEQKDKRIDQIESEKNALATKLAKYQQKETLEKRRHEKYRRIVLFLLNILWKVAAIAVITCVCLYLEKKYDSGILIYILSAVDIIGLILTVWVTLKKDVAKYFPKKDLNQVRNIE